MDTVRLTAVWRWSALFLLFAALALWAPWIHTEVAVSRFLRPLGSSFAALNLIWDLGGVPLTVLVLLVLTAVKAGHRRRAGALWIGFFAASLAEILAKHLIVTPTPVPVLEPAWMARLESVLNIGPSAAGAVLHHLLPGAPASTAASFLRGSYPSGHTFRTSYTAGALLGPRRRPWVAGVAALTAFCVIATGGHFLGDAIGGFLLAMAGLSVVFPAR